MIDILKRDDFMKAYPVDICAGLILGGVVSLIVNGLYVGSTITELAGMTAVMVGIFWVMGIVLSFNTGTHTRRL